MASQDLPPGVIIDTPDFTRGGGNYGLASFYPGVTIVGGKKELPHLIPRHVFPSMDPIQINLHLHSPTQSLYVMRAFSQFYLTQFTYLIDAAMWRMNTDSYDTRWLWAIDRLR